MRGFTLMELMTACALLVTFGAGVVTLLGDFHRAERRSAHYVADVTGLQRALRRLEDDLRAAPRVTGTTVGEVVYRLAGGRLLRDDATLLENVAAFELERDGSLVTVRLALAERARNPSRRAAVTARVRLRCGEEAR